MNLQETNKRIEKLFKEWRGLQPLKPEYQENLDKKIRLEWNYNSNHIEGNTLTYNEAELLLIENKKEGIHPERDYMEIKAHDLAIEKIKEFAADTNRGITEADIRNLNQIILKEPFWKEAETPDGQKTQKEIIPGQYKKQPNHVRTETGEIFKFAEPLEVPAKMKELVDWFNAEIQAPALPIPSFLAELHHRFICIHPFDDGNGRIARLWMNYVLMRLGYPPMVIKSEDKRNYFAALQKADNGDIDTFAVYLGNVLVFWLEKGIGAAKGENIREPEDIDKEVSTFIERQQIKQPIQISPDVLLELFKNHLQILSKTFEEKFVDFTKLFHSATSEVEGSNIGPHHTQITEDLFGKFILTNDLDKTKWGIINHTVAYHHYKASCTRRFDMKVNLQIQMREFEYQVTISTQVQNGATGNTGQGVEKKKEYGEEWDKREIEMFVAEGKEIFHQLLQKATGATP